MIKRDVENLKKAMAANGVEEAFMNLGRVGQLRPRRFHGRRSARGAVIEPAWKKKNHRLFAR